MSKFAKLFELPDENQILVTKREDEDENSDAPYVMRIETVHQGVTTTLNCGYESEDKRDEEFEKYDGEKAAKILASILLQFTETN